MLKHIKLASHFKHFYDKAINIVWLIDGRSNN